MASRLTPVSTALVSDRVVFHGNNKAEKGKTYKVLRSGWSHRGGVIVQNVRTGRVRTLPRYIHVFVQPA